jgi:hypothetical protein
LCNDCNYERLHNGASRAQIYKDKIKEREEIKTPRLIRTKYKPLKQQTTNEVEIKKKLHELKNSIEQKAIDNGVHYCWGCGKGGVSLDKSHILSVKQRKDLELDENNINLFCRDCHMIWESGSIEKMIVLNTFENDLLYIQKHDKKRYNKILLMIEEYSEKMFDLIVDGTVDVRVRELIEYFMKEYSYMEI